MSLSFGPKPSGCVCMVTSSHVLRCNRRNEICFSRVGSSEMHQWMALNCSSGYFRIKLHMGFSSRIQTLHSVSVVIYRKDSCNWFSSLPAVQERAHRPCRALVIGTQTEGLLTWRGIEMEKRLVNISAAKPNPGKCVLTDHFNEPRN